MKRTGAGPKPAYAKSLLTRQAEQQQQQQQRLAARVKEEERELYERQLGPAQGTKMERGGLESIPEQAAGREPEPAQEPAGPDQTMPSPTSGQGQSTTSEQGTPPPKEAMATSYINVSFAGLCPCIVLFFLFLTYLLIKIKLAELNLAMENYCFQYLTTSR